MNYNSKFWAIHPEKNGILSLQKLLKLLKSSLSVICHVNILWFNHSTLKWLIFTKLPNVSIRKAAFQHVACVLNGTMSASPLRTSRCKSKTSKSMDIESVVHVPSMRMYFWRHGHHHFLSNAYSSGFCEILWIFRVIASWVLNNIHFHFLSRKLCASFVYYLIKLLITSSSSVHLKQFIL